MILSDPDIDPRDKLEDLAEDAFAADRLMTGAALAQAAALYGILDSLQSIELVIQGIAGDLDLIETLLRERLEP